MQLTPIIAIHMTAALGAVVIGPVALWARKGAQQRPRLHRAFGYAWVTLMLATAISAIFIRDWSLPNIDGYTPIHLLIPIVLVCLFGAFWFLAKGSINGHRKTMQYLYIGACLVAGSFTLLPNRYLGNLLWGAAAASTPSASIQTSGDTTMLLQMLVNQPQMLGRVIQNTPPFVWALLVGLISLGLGQARTRTASLTRITVMSIAMTALSIWGTVSAFGASPLFGYVMLAWMLAAASMLAVIAPMAPPRGAAYDAASRSFALPGSWIPMLLILGIFLTKYVVGVDLTMQPSLARDGQYTLVVGALYGTFSGVFAGRAARLWRLAYRSGNPCTTPVLNA